MKMIVGNSIKNWRWAVENTTFFNSHLPLIMVIKMVKISCIFDTPPPLRSFLGNPKINQVHPTSTRSFVKSQIIHATYMVRTLDLEDRRCCFYHFAIIVHLICFAYYLYINYWYILHIIQLNLYIAYHIICFDIVFQINILLKYSLIW